MEFELENGVEHQIDLLEKEIIIELSIPKQDWQRLVFIEAHARRCEGVGFLKIAEEYRLILEKYNETRTKRIKGKNVDNLELEKLAYLIQQAKEESSTYSLKV